MKKSSLAILLAAPKGGRGADPGAESDDDEETSEDDYKSMAEEAFPDEEWTPERVSALKRLVMACMG